jgi:hypothetical protein
MPRLRWFVVLLLVLAWALAAGYNTAPALAQDQGLAVITSPLEGAGAAGILPISGTGTAPVVNEVLGRWDTSQISDGLYTLRLRVFYTDGAFLEAIVGNVRVQNATPTPSLGGPPEPTATLALPATATQPVIVLPPTSTPRATTVAVEPGGGAEAPPPGTGGSGAIISGDLLVLAFAAGVRLTLIGFLLLAAYVSLRAALRARPRR